MLQSNIVIPPMEIGSFGAMTAERQMYVAQAQELFRKDLYPVYQHNIDRIMQELYTFFYTALYNEEPTLVSFLTSLEDYNKLVATVYPNIAPLVMTNLDGRVDFLKPEGLYILTRYVKRLAKHQSANFEEQDKYLRTVLIAGYYHSIIHELTALRKEAKKKGMDLRKFTTDTMRFGLERIPYILRRYMEFIVVDENPTFELEYKYTYDVSETFYTALIATLLDKPLKETAAMIKKQKGGLFIPFLKPEEEVKVIRFLIDYKAYKYEPLFSGSLMKYDPQLLSRIANEGKFISLLGAAREQAINEMGGVMMELSRQVHQRDKNIHIYSMTDSQFSFQSSEPITGLRSDTQSKIRPVTGMAYDIYSGFL